MANIEREILRMASKGISQRSMATALGCSRHQIAKILKSAQRESITWPLPEGMSDDVLRQRLNPPTNAAGEHVVPDFTYIDKEMKKSGVTLTLLWAEYCEHCRSEGKKPFMYTQFCHHYRQHRQVNRATMRLERIPGEQVEVDWAGKAAEIVNPDTGERTTVYLFVATMSYSQYTYIEAFQDRTLSSWISAHVRMFQYLGGVPKIIIPDNLKTGVTKSDWYSPTIQKNYHEMAEHYDTVIVPARPLKPRDKPNVEGNVGHVTRGILAKIRHMTCFSLEELNDLLWEKLENFNHHAFQKKDGSRASWFEEERPLLLPLPKAPFELSSWHVATVQFNYHISLNHMHYSVPYQYIKQKVQVKCTAHTIEIYQGDTRIASHLRLLGRKGQYSTVEAHMPPDHQEYLAWDDKRFLAWAKTIGPATLQVISGILDASKIKQQAFRSCMGILKLADRYSATRLENACLKALDFSHRPSYKTVHNILKADENQKANKASGQALEVNSHAFTRGANHYRGGDHE